MIKFIILIFISNLLVVNCCNKSLCGSIVSKCLLTKECKCEEKFNPRCYKECFTCLEDLFQDCCSCFEFCPKIKVSTSNLNEISHVEHLEDPKPELFDVLTEENDSLGRWTSLSFPVELTFETADSKKKVKFIKGTKVLSGNDQVDFHSNCNVAFISKCLSWTKCKLTCISVGSSSYRWFHNGCCECIGSRNCVNYGLNYGKCSDCPSKLDNLNSDLVDHISSNDNDANIYDQNSNINNKNENHVNKIQN